MHGLFRVLVLDLGLDLNLDLDLDLDLKDYFVKFPAGKTPAYRTVI